MIPQKGYEELASVLQDALDQAQSGKGRERHACDKAFCDQSMQRIGDLVGEGYMAGQAIKKIQESGRLPADRAEQELLGAIIYCAGLIVWHRRQQPSMSRPYPGVVDSEVTE